MLVKENKFGLGVYADRSYKKGEVICVMKGRRFTPKTLYYHGNDFRKAIINPLQIDDDVYLDLERPYIFINHSCNPNTGVKEKTTLIAIKNIKKGNQITFDYSTTMDESFYCRCGSKKCRKAIVGFFGLPKKIQKYYYGKSALPDFIKRKYKKYNKIKKHGRNYS